MDVLDTRLAIPSTVIRHASMPAYNQLSASMSASLMRFVSHILRAPMSTMIARLCAYPHVTFCIHNVALSFCGMNNDSHFGSPLWLPYPFADRSARVTRGSEASPWPTKRT